MMAYIVLGMLIQSDGSFVVEKENCLLVDPEQTFTMDHLADGTGMKITLDVPPLEDKDDAATPITLTD